MEDYTQMSVNQRIALILKEVYGGNITQMARGTFIAEHTTLDLSKLKLISNIVSRMLGHTNLKQTLKYAEILEKDVRSDYDMIADKLK